jgi:hypothetical protein
VNERLVVTFADAARGLREYALGCMNACQLMHVLSQCCGKLPLHARWPVVGTALRINNDRPSLGDDLSARPFG